MILQKIFVTLDYNEIYHNVCFMNVSKSSSKNAGTGGKKKKQQQSFEFFRGKKKDELTPSSVVIK